MLRKCSELIEIVEYVNKFGLYIVLFINGIIVFCDLFVFLVKVGLNDVVFYVDII